MRQPVTRRFTMLSTIAACLVLVAGPATAHRCAGAKIKAIAKEEAGLLRCQAMVAAKGDPSLQAHCDARAMKRFAAAFGSAGACSGVQADCESLADDCRDKVRGALFALIQMLWDRSDPNGYAHHMTTDPLPDTPPHQVLIHEAFGDHQVANVATEVEARTIGASIHQPAIASGRSYEVTPYYGIPAIPSYPFDGSALIVWDSGAATPPTTNTAPTTGADPHSDPRNSPAARMQKSEFLQVGGAVVDVCSGMPCVAP